MKSYEHKLLQALTELHEKKLFWSSEPIEPPRIALWLHKKFGWQTPPLLYMGFWQNALLLCTILTPTKLLFDFFFFSGPAFMSTMGYWFGFVGFLLLAPTITAGLIRVVSWRKSLTPWEMSFSPDPSAKCR
ncbi:DUF6404 family protein [Maritalea mediterranea]|uniref:DUF6404 family protein n=1 Tax=Maritalea mediterranea TaxID=2909667 RepID=A0ABS9E566_9HYPH|nr:DUF6404 family protein [Maritalea mediterranea]MCF4098001.1 DUF6404 family protein [Maritalea mediterranea]